MVSKEKTLCKSTCFCDGSNFLSASGIATEGKIQFFPNYCRIRTSLCFISLFITKRRWSEQNDLVGQLVLSDGRCHHLIQTISFSMVMIIVVMVECNKLSNTSSIKAL